MNIGDNSFGWRAVLFDFDGVIVDSESRNLAVLEAVLGGYGVRLSDDERRWFGRNSWEACFDRLERERWLPIERLALAGEVMAVLRDDNCDRPLVGAAEAMQLASSEASVAVVTGSPTVEVNRILARLGLLSAVTLVIGAADVSEPKPSPEPYLKAMTILKAASAQCLVFEDSEVGIASGLEAGACVCAVAAGNCFRQNQGRATFAVPSFEVCDASWFRTMWRAWQSVRPPTFDAMSSARSV
jgi:beta-phosphoglucomutase-like phosphatase (HAD superfamily)